MLRDTGLSHRFQLPDGRRLGYVQYGADRGEPFFYFHGMPGSRYECRILHASALALGLRIYAVDRPGYGLSDGLEHRTLIDWPHDVTTLADGLGIETFGIIAVSGGGPYALACAHEIPERIRSIGIVGGLGPVNTPALRHAMSGLARFGFVLARTWPMALQGLYGVPLSLLSKIRPALAIRLLAQSLGGADKPVLLRDDVLGFLSENLREAFCQGASAPLQDILLYQSCWGFELGDIHKHIHLWHGNADRVVPCSHSEFVHAQLADAELSILPGEGHFSLPVLYAREILTRLREVA